MRAPRLAVAAVLVGSLFAASSRAGTLWADSPAASGPSPEERPARIRPWHVIVEGDLDSMKLARDFRAELERAAREDATVVVLELSGNGARADVLKEMIVAVASCAVPTVALLRDDRDSRVGSGQLALGLAAGRLEAAPGTAIESGDALAELAPEKTDLGDAAREAAVLLRARLEARGLPERVGLDVLAPVEEVWIRREGTDAVVSKEACGVCVRVCRRGAGAGFVVELAEADARGVGLIDAQAAGVAAVLRERGAAGVTPTRRRLASGLAAAREHVEKRFSEAARLLEEADGLLDLPERATGEVSPQTYRERGRRALGVLARVTAALDEAEGLLEEYPEIMRRSPEGKSGVGATSARIAGMWRSAMDEPRERAAGLKGKGERFSER